MVEAPKQDWAAYEALGHAHGDQRRRVLPSMERFAIYEDLYRLIADGRRAGDWDSLSAWQWRQKSALRSQLVAAYRKLDRQRIEQSASHDAD